MAEKLADKERGESEFKLAEGLMCKNCGKPVIRLSSGAYMCTKEGKSTSVVPVKPLTKPLEPPEGGHICPECGKSFSDEFALQGHIGAAHRKRKPSTKPPTKPLEETFKPPEETSKLPEKNESLESPPMPPELQLSAYVSEKLTTELRQVFGINEKQAIYIARTVKNNPQLAQNPTYLAYHIKQLAAKANDYQLQYVITGIYEGLKAEGIPGSRIIPTTQFSPPFQSPPAGYPPLPVQQSTVQQNPYPVYMPYPQGNPYPPPQYIVRQPVYTNPQGQGKPASAVTGEDLTKALKDQREDFQRTLNERDRNIKEDRDKDALKQTLDGVRKALDNLHTRVSGIEKDGVNKKPSDENIFNKTILGAIGKDISDRLTGAKGELTPEKIRLVVGDEVKRHLPPSPSGTRNQFDMEVEKAQHDARARMIEAEENRKGYEAIAGGIKDGLGGLGWNIGAGASGGPPKESNSQTQTITETPISSEPQPMEWRDGLWHTRCVYSDCHAPLTFEDGKSTVMCPSCNRVIQVQPAEEELEQKRTEETQKEEIPEKPVEAPPKPETETPVETKGAEEPAKTAEKA